MTRPPLGLVCEMIDRLLGAFNIQEQPRNAFVSMQQHGPEDVAATI